MLDLILVALLSLIVGGALIYIYKEKKKGTVCIGCPYGEQCANKDINKCVNSGLVYESKLSNSNK